MSGELTYRKDYLRNKRREIEDFCKFLKDQVKKGLQISAKKIIRNVWGFYKNHDFEIDIRNVNHESSNF